jgi:hypothetical protein
MKIVIALLILCIFSNCKEFEKEVSEISYEVPDTKLEKISEPPKVETEKPIWIKETFKNFSFEKPNNLKIERSLSNENKKVYTSDDNFAMTIDIDYVPSGYENSSINDLITSPSQFAEAVNQNQIRNFSDFKLIGYNYAQLGNKKSFVINQKSKDVSGSKNIYMDVKNHFLVTSPYYCSISFSFPQNSKQHLTILSKIENSFVFPESKIVSSKAEEVIEIEEEEQTTNINRPSLYETKKWILEKFKSYGNPDNSYNLVGYDLIITTSTDPAIAIEYTIPLCNSSIYEDRYSTSYNDQIKFTIKDGRMKIDRNWKGFPHYVSSFGFDFKYSSEDNLVNRINDALDNLKYYCPKDSSKKQTF